LSGSLDLFLGEILTIWPETSRFSSCGKRKSCALNPKELAKGASVEAFDDFH